jgi:hypothetical protein
MRQALATVLVLLLGVLMHPMAVGHACAHEHARAADGRPDVAAAAPRLPASSRATACAFDDLLAADDDDPALAPIADAAPRPLLGAALATRTCPRAQAECWSPAARSRGPPV